MPCPGCSSITKKRTFKLIIGIALGFIAYHAFYGLNSYGDAISHFRFSYIVHNSTEKTFFDKVGNFLKDTKSHKTTKVAWNSTAYFEKNVTSLGGSIAKQHNTERAVTATVASTNNGNGNNRSTVSGNSTSSSTLTITKPMITTVTGYFNLGSFSKGSASRKFTPDTYRSWMRAYSKILTPVVAYFDNDRMLGLFRNITKHRPNIMSIFINRTNLWSFKLRDRIAEIYQQPNYAKHLPNTVIPEYSCAMHAKYDLLNITMNNNYFKTDYFMWMDIGYFRYTTDKEPDFGLSVPDGFDESKIAFTEFSALNRDLSLHNIVFDNHVWVAGGGILGRDHVLRAFSKQYVDFVNIFMNENLMSTDQQILYGMFVKSSEKYKPKIQIQTYKSGWFKLGEMCKKSWKDKHKHPK